MPTVVAPTVLSDPGYLFAADLATAVPTHTVAGSKFTDAWAVTWVPLGPTEDGSALSYETTVEAMRVAEFFDPVKWATTDRSGSFAFNLADWTLDRVKLSFNGGTKAIVSGVGATQLTKYTPVTPGAEVRKMIGWESLDSTVRIVAYQCINSGTIESAFRKAPAMALIPCNFRFEVPASGVPFEIWTAGATRAGAGV